MAPSFDSLWLAYRKPGHQMPMFLFFSARHLPKKVTKNLVTKPLGTKSWSLLDKKTCDCNWIFSNPLIPAGAPLGIPWSAHKLVTWSGPRFGDYDALRFTPTWCISWYQQIHLQGRFWLVGLEAQKNFTLSCIKNSVGYRLCKAFWRATG